MKLPVPNNNERMIKKEKRKKRKKEDRGFGFFSQTSKFFHTLYFQYKDLYLSRF